MLLVIYILTAFRRYFLLTATSFAGLYLLIEFFDKVDNFTKHHAGFGQYLAYFLCKIPEIVVQTAPLAVLLGVFLTVGGLSHNNELTAMRAGGMSLFRIGLPLLGAGLAVSLLIVAVGEWLAPITSRKANHVYDVELGGPVTPKLSRDNIWLRDGDAIVKIRLVIPEQQAMSGIVIQEIDRQSRPLRRIDAAAAVYRDGGWVGRETIVTRFDPVGGEVVAVERPVAPVLPLSKTPDDFRTTAARNNEMGIRDLAALSRRVGAEGYDNTRYRVDLHGRIALPFSAFVMAFIGIPFALRQGRGASLAVGIAFSVATGVAYHLMQGTMLAFGYSGALPVPLAAWGPNLCFALLGLALLVGKR